MLATSELAQAWQRYVLNGFIFPQVKPTCEPPQSTIGDAAASALLFASAFDWLRLDPLVGIIGARHVSETQAGTSVSIEPMASGCQNPVMKTSSNSTARSRRSGAA
jgi:hypothetical protein